MDVARVRPGSAGVAGDQHQGLVEQPFHRQTGAAFRGVHDADVDGALDQPLHDALLEADLQAQGDVREGLAHPDRPARQEVFPEGDPAAQCQFAAEPAGQADLVAGLFQGADQGLGMAVEAASGGGHFRAALAAPEQAGAHLRLQGLDAAADRGLGDVQAGGGADEIAGGGHGQEGAGVFDFHGVPYLLILPIYNYEKYRLFNGLWVHRLTA
jgi:hypothetical protein